MSQQLPQQQILAAMQHLAGEGKAITTAAVRARLTHPVPLNELLALVSRYKHAPQSLPHTPINGVKPQQQDDSQPQLQVRLAALEHTVAEQTLRLTQLETLLMANLTNSAKD